MAQRRTGRKRIEGGSGVEGVSSLRSVRTRAKGGEETGKEDGEAVGAFAGHGEGRKEGRKSAGLAKHETIYGHSKQCCRQPTKGAAHPRHPVGPTTPRDGVSRTIRFGANFTPRSPAARRPRVTPSLRKVIFRRVQQCPTACLPSHVRLAQGEDGKKYGRPCRATGVFRGVCRPLDNWDLSRLRYRGLR